MPPHFVTATALVGRHDEITTLNQHVEQLMLGVGSTVLLGGEAGIGKSRLIRELKREFECAATRHHVAGSIVTGQCSETDQTLPYAPLLDLLRVTLARRSDDEIRTLLGNDLPEFVMLLPEFGYLQQDATSRPALDPSQEKQRLFQVLLRFLTRRATGARMLVVIEDLHWSDDTSLEFLLHLANRLESLPILLVLSYRSDEIQPSLRRMLATLDRSRRATDLQLARLSPSDVDRMLRAIFNQPQAIQSDFLHTIHGLTDGNPFFIEEVLRALIAAGDIFKTSGRWDRKDLSQLQIPRSIQDAVARRTERLSSEASEVLRLAAVAGRVFDFDLLEELTRFSEVELLALMRELLDVQVVEEESADRFAFRHALTRQAVYSQLLSRERRNLHQAIGETLEQLHGAVPEPHLADLAYHFATAEDWPRAVDYAQRAGERALRLFAPRAAAEQFSRALHAAAHLGREPAPDLFRARALAYATLGQFDLADLDRRTVLELARASNDRMAEWRSLLELGELWSGLDYARSGDYLEQALTLARELGETRLIAESLTQIGGWLINREETVRAGAMLQDALDIYITLNDPHGTARTIDLLGTVADINADMVRMDQCYQAAAAQFRALDDRPALSSTLATNAVRAGAMGLLESVVTVSGVAKADILAEPEEALTLARSIDWRAGEAYAALISAGCLGSAGRYADAFSRATLSVGLSTEIEHREWMTGGHYFLGSLYFDVLAFEQARPHFEQAAALGREGGSLHWLHLTAGGLADLAASEGGLDEADTVLQSLAPDLPTLTIGQRRVGLAKVRLALARGDAPGALTILDRLFATAANFSGPADIPYLAWLRGQALHDSGQFDQAEEALLTARRGAEAREMSNLLWRIDYALGQVYHALGRMRERDAALELARKRVDSIASMLPDETLQTIFRDRANLLGPRGMAAEPNRDAALTPRERDVAILLTRGLSNREIADKLFVGERTVETHVGNILAKLEFRSRTQVASWAIVNGLVARSDTTT